MLPRLKKKKRKGLKSNIAFGDFLEFAIAEAGMGLTLVASMPSAVVLGSYFAVKDSAPTYISLPLLHASLVGFAAAIAAHPAINYTALFGKKSDGSFPWLSYAAFYPYLLSLKVYVNLRRLKTKEPVFDEITQGLFVGGWPTLQRDLPPGELAVVDCTCELPRSLCVQELPYLCVPTWDTRGLHPEEIELAVRWALKRRGQGNPVLIHCAFGHGRSVTVMCALLVTLGVCDTWQNAEDYIKLRRPRARLNIGQKKSLIKWSASFGDKRARSRRANDPSGMQLSDVPSETRDGDSYAN